MYSVTGVDKSNLIYVAASIEEYLAQYYDILRNDRLFVHDGEISAFRSDPTEICGSVTITQGIKVEA